MRTIILLFSLLFILPNASNAGQIYKWVDDEGSLHVTDNPTSIPAKYRDQVKSKEIESRKPGAESRGDESKFVYMCGYNIKSGGKNGEDRLANVLFYSVNGVITKWNIRERIPENMSHMRSTFDAMINKNVSELPKDCAREARK